MMGDLRMALESLNSSMENVLGIKRPFQPKGGNMMLSKPLNCCDFGDYSCQIPMGIAGRVRYIDFCIADIVGALNAANIVTVASCCGHGKQNGVVSLKDGREISIKREGY